jgi:gas vesicle protein
MSSDSDAPPTEGGDKTERMDRLRALLTKPIKIPESASSDNEDADYAAPVAAAAAPKGAKTPMTSQGSTPKGAKTPVETPPAVKAAAEALDRLSDEEKEAVVDGAGQAGRPSRSRRTWADAYLAKPDKPLTPEEVRAELTVTLKEQGTELRELVAKQSAAQEKAQEQALAQAIEQTREQASAELATSAEQTAAAARQEAELLQGRIDELTTVTGTLRTDLDAARAVAVAAQAAADSAATAASAAREAADAAAKKAATASAFAWVGIALALVAAVVAVVV